MCSIRLLTQSQFQTAEQNRVGGKKIDRLISEVSQHAHVTLQSVANFQGRDDVLLKLMDYLTSRRVDHVM